MERKRIVVISGAGISAESGIKTFRGEDGTWQGYRFEEVATPDAWAKDPILVLKFYNERRIQVRAAEPNGAHLLLAQMQDEFDIHIVTQNIDDLHERAGSKNVLHLHGEILKARDELNAQHIVPLNGKDIEMGDLSSEGNQLRPHVVWFHEPVPAMGDALNIVASADILLVVGTSLQVYPAASLIHEIDSDVPIYLVDPSASSFGQLPDKVIKVEEGAVKGIKMFFDEILGS